MDGIREILNPKGNKISCYPVKKKCFCLGISFLLDSRFRGNDSLERVLFTPSDNLGIVELLLWDCRKVKHYCI